MLGAKRRALKENTEQNLFGVFVLKCALQVYCTKIAKANVLRLFGRIQTETKINVITFIILGVKVDKFPKRLHIKTECGRILR